MGQKDITQLHFLVFRIIPPFTIQSTAGSLATKLNSVLMNVTSKIVKKVELK